MDAWGVDSRRERQGQAEELLPAIISAEPIAFVTKD